MTTTSNLTVADLLVRRIALDGIDTIFSLTGGGIMYLVDSIARSKDVSLIPTHHEEYAGVAADGFARAGKPYGVAIGTTGPGAAHLFTSIAAAWQDSSPVLFIAGQVKTSDSTTIQNLDLRQNGTFEFDTTKAFAPISKHIVVLRSPQTAADDIEDALRIMRRDRPGPVVIEIPLDIQGALVLPAYQLSTTFDEMADSKADPRRYECIVSKALEKSDRPLVLLGVGVIRSGVVQQIVKSLEIVGIPYITTQFARGGGRSDNPLYLGSPGIKANRSANIAMMNCDLLIAIGTSLHQQVIGWDSDHFKSSPSYKIWFEIDGNTIAARKDLVDLAIQMSSQNSATLLINQLKIIKIPSMWQKWQEITSGWASRFLLHYPFHVEVEGRMCLYRVISCLNRYAKLFSAVVTDAGLVWYAVAQHYFTPEGSYFISSGSFGAMGMALPLAIGAAAATRRPVLAITGDGSAMMCLSELATLRSQSLPVLYVINNNDGYVSIRTTHNRYFDGRTIGTDQSNGVFIPKFSEVAKTFDLPYLAAHSLEELQDILDNLLSRGINGPTLLEVFTYTDQAVEPVVVSRRAPNGDFISPSLIDMYPTVDFAHE